MTETTPPTPTGISAWNASLAEVRCTSCGWRYLIPAGHQPAACPHCCHSSLEVVNNAETPEPFTPELLVPFSLTESALKETIAEFANGIPFPQDDLNVESLQQRLCPVYLPMWLVDGHVCATWEAEVGFNYEVISHQEYLDINEAWYTREVKETRVRWEPRVGQLNRFYQNVALPAVDDAPMLEKQLGGFDPEPALPYTAASLIQEGRPTWVRLPDHEPQDAWSEITAEFQKTATEECQLACDAGQIRQFRWKAEINDLNWTLILLPAYTSYYEDDDGRPQPLLIHGQTGKITGSRIASMRRARQSGMIFLLLGLIMAAAGVLVGLDGINLLAVMLVIAGVITAMTAMTQSNQAWDFNRQQMLTRASSFTHKS